MKNRNWTMVCAGILAAALLWVAAGCLSPISTTPAAELVDPPAASGVAEGEFTVTLQVGEGPPVPASRSVVGPDTGGIQYGGIRNIAQVIAVDAATGGVVDFQQVSRPNDGEPSSKLTVRSLWTGNRYHFLVLMGHRERDYAEEAKVVPWQSDSLYIWKTDGTGGLLPPTLLAAGLLADQTINGSGTITVPMQPLVADTVFVYGGGTPGSGTAQAAIPTPAVPDGTTLPAKVAANLVWTLTGGFATLLDAQKKAGSQTGGQGGINLNWGEAVSLTAKTTILCLSTDQDPDGTEAPAVLSGADRNQIVLPLGERDPGTSGSANFNLEYLPFGAGDMDVFTAFDPDAASWIIRNGVNDQAQNAGTVFPNPSASSPNPWKGTTADKENGNGAVAFEFVDDKITNVDLANLLPAPVAGGMPVTGTVNGGTYTGTVVWTAVVGGTSKARFEAETVYMATVTSLVAKDGFSFSNDFTVTHSGSSGILHVPGNASKAEVLFPKTGVFWEHDGLFSGSSTGDMDSAIDIINKAKDESFSALFLKLLPWPETVDFTVSGTDIDAGLVLTTSNSPAVVILDGGGKTIELTGTKAGSVVTVGSGVTLTLRNITFKGNADNTSALISVAAGGTLVLEDGAVITGNKGSSSGGGVLVGVKSKFVMKGGEISGSTAGPGVYVANDSTGSGSTFEMSGGKISNNKLTSGSGGGVYVTKGNKFEMSGGEISGNTAASRGGGVWMSQGTFEMSGGKISNNTTADNGGGVYVQSGTSKLVMTGGEISNNTAANNGGGVHLGGGTFEMSGGTISGNTANGNSGGGGVYVGDRFTMNGGTISGNTAATSGGGVYVYSISGTFTKMPDTSKGSTTSGVICGYTAGDARSNWVGTRNPDGTPDTHETNKGDAVWYANGGKYRNSTLDEADEIRTDTLTIPPWDQ